MAFNFNPGSYTARPLDFSSLANVPEDFWKGQEVARQAGLRDALAKGLPTSPDGSIDWAKAASIVGQYDPQLGMRTAAYAQKETLTPAQILSAQIALRGQDRQDARAAETAKTPMQRQYEAEYGPIADASPTPPMSGDVTVRSPTGSADAPSPSSLGAYPFPSAPWKPGANNGRVPPAFQATPQAVEQAPQATPQAAAPQAAPEWKPSLAQYQRIQTGKELSPDQAIGKRDLSFQQLDLLKGRAEALLKNPNLDFAVGKYGNGTNKMLAPYINPEVADTQNDIDSLRSDVKNAVLAQQKEGSSTGSTGFGRILLSEWENFGNIVAPVHDTNSPAKFRQSLKQIITFVNSSKNRVDSQFSRVYPGFQIPKPEASPPPPAQDGTVDWTHYFGNQ